MTTEGYLDKGDEYYDNEEFEKAIEYFSKAIDLDSKYAKAFIYRGNAKCRLNELKSAILDFNKAIDFNPNNAIAFNNRGNAKNRLKDYYSGIEDYNEAIKLKPNFAQPFNGRGTIKRNLSDFYGAIEDYNMAIKIYPEYARAYYNRGISKRCLNEYENAIKDFDSAIKLDQNFANPWSGKANVYYDQDQYQLALSCLFRANYLGYNNFEIQSALNNLHPVFPFFIFRQIQNNLPPKQYNQYANTIQLVLNQCLPLYSFIAYKAINRNYEKDLWQRILGAINYYCGDPIISYSIFKNFILNDSNTLVDYYYAIISCLDFFENTDTFLAKAISLIEPLKQQNYEHPSVQSKNLPFDLLQLYYAGLIFELNDTLENALICFEKIAPYFLPAKYKQMELLFDLGNKEASENIHQSILDQEVNLDEKTGFARGLNVHTFNLKEDRIENLFPHYFYYLEIESAIDHFVENSESDVEFDLEYPGFQPNFWELFKVNPIDVEATRIRANVAPLIAQYKIQIEEYGSSFDPNNKPASIQEDNAFRQAFKTLDALDNKVDLQLELGLHIQDFSLPAEQYEELSTYFFVKGYLNNYEKLMLDFYALAKQLSTKEKSPILVAGLGKMIQSFIGKYLGWAVTAITGALSYPPLVAAFIGVTTQAGVNFTAGSLAALFKNYYTHSQNQTVESFQLFKNDFENFIAQEKERLGDNFEKRYPIRVLYENNKS